jgi:uncharacterized Zn-binding protein involved in type VI secretion
MGQPAARIGDMHVCPMFNPGLPMIPHVGGPVTGPGCPTVLIGGVPAAVVGDMCTCVGPPDSIIKGSAGVFIGGKPAARMGDQCAHGGTITVGLPTVLIGETRIQAFQEANREKIEQAIKDAKKMLENKLKALENWDAATQADVKKWMGDSSEATRQMLIDRIKKELGILNNLTVSNFQPAKDPKLKNAYAYVYPDDENHTIYLGSAFENAPAVGEDSKAGTLTHEVSHFNDVGGTADNAYGTDNAKQLAKDDPAKAKNNADSFEYFIEH